MKVILMTSMGDSKPKGIDEFNKLTFYLENKDVNFEGFVFECDNNNYLIKEHKSFRDKLIKKHKLNPKQISNNPVIIIDNKIINLDGFDKKFKSILKEIKITR